MAWIFRVLLITTLSIVLVVFYPNDPGEVLIRLPGIGHIQTTPLVFIIVLFLFIISVILLFQALGWVFSLPFAINHHWQKSRTLRADERLLTGWTWLSSGGYAEALQLAKKTYKSGLSTTEAALLAARAEMKMDHYDEASMWISKIEGTLPRHQLLKDLMQAKLYLHRQEQSEALGVINALENRSGFNSVLGRLRIQAYLQSKQWADMLKLNRVMFKKGLSPQSDYQIWNRLARMGELNQLSLHANGSQHLQAQLLPWWKKLDDDEQRDEELLLGVMNSIASFSHQQDSSDNSKDQMALMSTAREWLEKIIDKRLNDTSLKPSTLSALLSRYSDWVPLEELDVAINRCQRWLTLSQENASLLRATARLCERRELWGNAIRYYETSLSFEPNPLATFHLAKIYRHIGQPDKAKNLQNKLFLALQP